jgi:hypothetical protein
MSTSSKISDPQETAAAMHPAAAGEAPAATESEAPITTQVLAADDVCQPLAFAVFACAGKGVLADNPQFDENDSAIGAVFLLTIILERDSSLAGGHLQFHCVDRLLYLQVPGGEWEDL